MESPLENKAGTTSKPSLALRKAKQASKAPAQAMEKIQRQARGIKCSGKYYWSQPNESGSTCSSTADENNTKPLNLICRVQTKSVGDNHSC